jgi:hypothetical protein
MSRANIAGGNGSGDKGKGTKMGGGALGFDLHASARGWGSSHLT